MKRKAVLSILFLSLIVFATGCWNRRELNELGIVVGLGIDKSGDQYEISVQVVNPSEIAAKTVTAGRLPVVTFSMKGRTIFEAIRRLSSLAPRRLYFAHIRILVLGEELARDGIGKSLDLISRDHEFRTDFYVVVSKGTSAKEILSILPPLERVPANKMFESLRVSEKNWAPSLAVKLDELIKDVTSQGTNPVLTGITTTGDPVKGSSKDNLNDVRTENNLKYTGLAVFRNDKLVGWLNEEESKGHNYIIDRVKSTLGWVHCPTGGKIAVEGIRSKTKVKGKVSNGKPIIDIDLHAEANIGEVQCRIDLTKNETIAQLEALFGEKLKGLLKTTLNKAKKEFKADIFGFGESIHRSNPAAWKSLKKNWDRHFVDSQVNIAVDIKIRRLGTVSNSFEVNTEEKETEEEE